MKYICMLTLLFTQALTAAEQPDWQASSVNLDTPLRASAISAKTLWVAGGKSAVFISKSNGKLWLDKSVPVDKSLDFRDIEVFDEQTAIVMSSGAGSDSRLYITNNAGTNWQLLYQNRQPAGFFNSIAFWDRKNGLLMGDPIDGYFVIERTKDGGKTWQRISKKQLPPMTQDEAAFAASGNTLIVSAGGKAWFTTGGKSASVYTSEDFGHSWQKSAVNIYSKTNTSGGYALGLNHQQKLFVMGGDYLTRQLKHANLASLENGQWQTLSTSNNGLRTAFACVETMCITTGKLSSDISYDSGETWQPLNSKLKRGFFTLASDGNMILAAGANGDVALMQ